MAIRFTDPRDQFLDSNGNPLSGGTLDFYASGTSTRQDTFSDAALTTANSNPVTLDANGRLPNAVFLQAKDYKVVFKDVDGVTVWTEDPVGLTSGGGAVTTFRHYSDLRGVSPSNLATGDQARIAGRSDDGDGGEGHFRWDSSDFSSATGNGKVPADEVTPGEGDGGIYVAPSSDKSGASGAWVRLTDKVTNGYYGDLQRAFDGGTRLGYPIEVLSDTYITSSTVFLDRMENWRITFHQNAIIKPDSSVHTGLKLGRCNDWLLERPRVDMTDMVPEMQLTDTSISFDKANDKILDSNNNLDVFRNNEVIHVKGSGSNDGHYFIVSVSSGEMVVSGPLVDESAGNSTTLSLSPVGIRVQGAFNHTHQSPEVFNTPEEGVGMLITPFNDSMNGAYWGTINDVIMRGSGLGGFHAGFSVDVPATSTTYNMLRNDKWKFHGTGSGMVIINPYCAIFVSDTTSTVGGEHVTVIGGENSDIDCKNPGEIHAINYAFTGGGSSSYPPNPIFQTGARFVGETISADGIRGREQGSSISKWQHDFFGSSGYEIFSNSFNDEIIRYKAGGNGNTGRIEYADGWGLAINHTVAGFDPGSDGETITIDSYVRFLGVDLVGIGSSETAIANLPPPSDALIISGTMIHIAIRNSKGNLQINGNGRDILKSDGTIVSSITLNDVGATVSLMLYKSAWIVMT